MSTNRPLPSYPLHLFSCILVTLVLFAGLAAHASRSFAFGDRVPVEPDRGCLVESRLDPNTAPWIELTALPGIGEAMARRIIDYRESRLAADPACGPVFRAPADLGPIKGIGPRLIERMQPHLRFHENAEPAAHIAQ